VLQQFAALASPGLRSDWAWNGGAYFEATQPLKRISRDPRFIQPGHVLAGRDERRFNVLASVAGDAPQVENRDRHVRIDCSLDRPHHPRPLRRREPSHVA
jgi:hypothetical protein